MQVSGRVLLPLAILAMIGSSGGVAHARNKAERAAERAMNELFSAAAFGEARATLESTIRECDRCSKHTLAVLHADLAIVLITGLHDTGRGAAEMRAARAGDPALTLDPAFVTDEVQAAFDAAGSGKVSPLEEDVVLEDEPDDEPKRKPRGARKAPEPECSTNTDCGDGNVCRGDRCVPAPPRPRERSVWLSVGLIQDVAFVSGTDLCTRSSQVNSGNTCLRASGSQYHGTPVSGQAGSLGLAPSIAATRVTLASYFALSTSVSGGLRMGYAFAGDAPTPDGGKRFFPLHAEVLLAYWLSPKALSSDHVGGFLEASGGIAQMAGHGSARIQENTAVPPPVSQLDNPPTQELDVYRNSGLGFAGAGAGIFVPLGAGVALIADLRLSLFLPATGMAVGLGAGMAFGL